MNNLAIEQALLRRDAMTPIEVLLNLLDLEKIDANLWRGVTPKTGRARVYGGQVIAQSLVAAIRSVENRRVHSLHGYFMLPGDPNIPILYEVDRIRDGKSFTTRRVRAIQNGAAIFAMMASFQVEAQGHHHQMPLPDIAMPENLPGEDEIRARYVPQLSPTRQLYWRAKRPIEVRPVDPNAYFNRKPGDFTHALWFRASDRLPDNPNLHAVILAYASDMSLLDGAMVAHGKSVADPDIQAASLDHALWFHEDFRVDEWLLYSQDSPWTGHARGLGRGLVYSRDGRLVASAIQEGLIRPV